MHSHLQLHTILYSSKALQVIDFDGGQQFLGNGAGFTNTLHEKVDFFVNFCNFIDMFQTPEDWAQIEALIRGRTGKSKM